jgi:hypothetical protein
MRQARQRGERVGVRSRICERFHPDRIFSRNLSPSAKARLQSLHPRSSKAFLETVPKRSGERRPTMAPFGAAGCASLPAVWWSAGRRPCPTLLGTRARKRPPPVTGTGRGARRACVNGPSGASTNAPGRLSALHSPFGEGKTETGEARAANNRAGGAMLIPVVPAKAANDERSLLFLSMS